MSDCTVGRRGLRRMRSPHTGLLAVMAGTALLTAACGSGPGSPQVASLSSGGSGSSAPASPKGTPAQLLNEWAACMRSHGDSSQADPTIDARKGQAHLEAHLWLPPPDGLRRPRPRRFR